MQQDNNNTDKKLKQLENQSLPDLSKMDEHWNDLKNSLRPEASLPESKNANKIFRWIVAALFAGIGFFVFYKFIFTVNDKTIAAQKEEPTLNTKSTNDTLPTIQFIPGQETSTIIGKDTIRFKPQKEKNTKQVFIFKGKTTDGKEVEFIAIPPADTTSKKPVLEKKKTLRDFFAEMEKESQSFVINNKRDTAIQGNAGTSLLIPANTFGSNERVTITMKEYYSYEDMITNRLSTTSNGQQLVTGGMIYLTASINGREVNIQPGESIRWFIPDTTTEMKQMQLFNGVVNNTKALVDIKEEKRIIDTVDIYTSPANINWIPQQSFFSGSYLYTSVRVLDLRDEPYKTRYTKNGKVGKFIISPDSEISKNELENYLLTKNGYDKVIIKERKKDYKRRGFLWFTGITYYKKWESLGDSAWIDIAMAKRYNLKATDTVVSTQPGLGTRVREYEVYVYDGKRPPKKFDTAFSKTNLNNLANRFSVDIRTLGWINCDRFYNDYRPKIEFVVNLGDTASNYYTLLVFDKIKSMMTGYISGNKVAFTNVPEGETAKIISISIKDGKPVAAMQSVQLSRKVFEGMKFEETSVAEFKEKAGGLDKP